MGLSAFCLFECEIVGLRKSRRRFNSSRLQRPQPDSLMLTMHLGSRLLPSDDKSRCTGCGKHISSRSHCLLACHQGNYHADLCILSSSISTYHLISLHWTTRTTHNPRRTLLPHGLHTSARPASFPTPTEFRTLDERNCRQASQPWRVDHRISKDDIQPSTTSNITRGRIRSCRRYSHTHVQRWRKQKDTKAELAVCYAEWRSRRSCGMRCENSRRTAGSGEDIVPGQQSGVCKIYRIMDWSATSDAGHIPE